MTTANKNDAAKGASAARFPLANCGCWMSATPISPMAMAIHTPLLRVWGQRNHDAIATHAGARFKSVTTIETGSLVNEKNTHSMLTLPAILRPQLPGTPETQLHARGNRDPAAQDKNHHRARKGYHFPSRVHSEFMGQRSHRGERQSRKKHPDVGHVTSSDRRPQSLCPTAGEHGRGKASNH